MLFKYGVNLIHQKSYCERLRKICEVVMEGLKCWQIEKGSSSFVRQILPEAHALKTVPTFATRHTFCASGDIQVSYGWCLL